MNVKAYYKANVSNKFNEDKQRDILSKYSKEQLVVELNRQLVIKRDCLFDKVNSRVNNGKMVLLLKSLL
jgi:hypothetical protein